MLECLFIFVLFTDLAFVASLWCRLVVVQYPKIARTLKIPDSQQHTLALHNAVTQSKNVTAVSIHKNKEMLLKNIIKLPFTWILSKQVTKKGLSNFQPCVIFVLILNLSIFTDLLLH